MPVTQPVQPARCGEMPGRAGIKTWILCMLWFVGPGYPCFAAPADVTLLSVRRIWDAAPHNAFTDLVRFRGEWFCVFREGKGHVSPDGALRVLTSKDGEMWSSAALLTSTNADLRDAKITTTPDGQLMLSGAGALHQPAAAKHRSMAWFSEDGRRWSEPVVIG